VSALPHHLAAVWFADVVGYTTLSEEDEAAAWRLVQAFQGVVRDTVDRFGGREARPAGSQPMTVAPFAVSRGRSYWTVHVDSIRKVPWKPAG
jgi:class 3 adenylate cyclase